MKTNILLRTAAVMAALSSLFGCDYENPLVEKHRILEMLIHPSTILSDFNAYKSENFEMFEGAKLRITCLLYDRDGNLAYQEETLLDNFDQDVSFRTTLVEEDGLHYTIIALASCIRGTLSSPTNEAYSISGKESLEQLRVEQTKTDGYSYYSTWSVMGYASRSVSIYDSVVWLNMKPATSLVYLRWQNIHAHDNDGSSTDVYGTYSAHATDYWDNNMYSWKITVEKDGNSTTDVIVKDFSPYLNKKGYTSDKGCNTYKGIIKGNTLTITQGQATGCSVDNEPIILYGGESNGTNITLKDISLRIDKGKLTATTMFGVHVSKGTGWWYDLFKEGVVFTKESSSTKGSSVGIDSYGIIYHSNNIMRFTDDGSPVYSTSLSSNENNGTWVTPAEEKSATNIYSMHNLFPGSSMNLFARAYTGNTYTDYSMQKISLVSGHQYVLDFDCEAFKLIQYEGVLGSRASTDVFEPLEGNPLQLSNHVVLSQNN